MEILIFSLIVIVTVVLMEAWAWFSHKFLLHGPLWFLHKSHHRPQQTWWEWNDLVSLIYGLMAALAIILGQNGMSWLVAIGIGISLYGLLYFYLHDIIIHRRIKIKYNFRSGYIKRLIRAHKKHHKHMQKDRSEAFGFLYAHPRYKVK